MPLESLVEPEAPAARSAGAIAPRAAPRRESVLPKSLAALQAVTDAVARLDRLDALIPAALRIVADAFGSPSAGYYDFDGAKVRLRWWLDGERTYAPAELLALGDRRYEHIRMLAQGFTVPDSYFGIADADRTHAYVLDHTRSTAVPEFDEIARALDWHHELNVPLRTLGCMSGALCIYRGEAAGAYTADEISLSEALAKPLAFAAQAARVAAEIEAKSVEAAVAREQGAAARARADELVAANESLRRTVAQLADRPDPRAFLGAVLCEVTAQLGMEGGHLVLYDEDTDRLITYAHVDGGKIVPLDLAFPATVPASEVGAVEILRESRGPRRFDPVAEAHLFWPGTVEFHRQRGNKAVWTVPLRFGERFAGFLGTASTNDRVPAPEKLALVQALAHQATLAAELIRLGERDREAAVAREQERAARERACELAKVNETLRRGLDRTTELGRLDALLVSILSEGADVFAADAAAVILREGEGTCFRIHAVVDDGRLLDADEIAGDPFLGTYAEVSARDPGGILTSILAAPRNTEVVLDNSLRADWPEAHAWHASRGHRIAWQFPLRMRGVVRGFFAFALRRVESPSTVQQESVAALAQQVTLAVEMQRLADEARDAAVAREQERSARERADALDSMNRQLQLRDRLLTAVAAATRILLGAGSLAEHVQEALALIGEAAGIHRVKVILQRDGWHELAHEWSAEGFVAQASLGPTRFADADIGNEYVAPARAGQSRWQWIDDVPAELREPFERVGMQSMGIVPIFGDGGYLGLVAFDDCKTRRRWVDAEIETLGVAAQAIGAAIAREQEQARRTAELEKTSLALQATIDAIAALDTLDAFIPAALRIVADAFEVRAAGFYETIAATIFLRFWLQAGETFGPEDLPGLADVDRPLMRRMASGFTVPFEHLGVDVLHRTSRPNIVHHAEATASPDMHAFCRRMGWAWELNVPLMVDGEARGAITLARGAERPFSAAEVALGESLGKQIALAMQTCRIAEREREAAIARERAAELAKANAALSRSTAQLVSHDSLSKFLEAVVHESIAAIGAVTGAVFLLDVQGEHLCLRTLVVRGDVVDIACDPRADAYRDPVPVADNAPWQAMMSRQFFWLDYAARDPDDWPQSYDWHNAMGHRLGVCVPMIHDGGPIGFLGFAFDRSVDVQPSETRLEVAFVLAQQVTLAVRLTRLADEARGAAVARERETAAQERAAELEYTNEALRRAIGDLADIDSLDDFLTEMLRAAIEVAGAANGTVSLLKDDMVERPVVLHGVERLSRAAKERMGVWRTPAQPPFLERIRSAQAQGDLWAPRMEDLTVLPALAQYHRELGNRAVRFVPLAARGELVGWIGLGFADDTPGLPRRSNLLRLLAGQITVAVEMARLGEEARSATLADERNRVAGEIHDSLAQNFAGVALQLETAEHALLNDEPEAARVSVGRARDLARFGLAEARRSVMTLRPSATLAMGLVPALQALCSRSHVEGKLVVPFAASGTPVLLDGEVELTLFRIAQEALSNAMRHAEAGRVALGVDYDDDGVTLVVADDGRGIGPDAGEGGQGVTTMRERARRVGGRCDVSARRERGTEVRAWVPYRRGL